MTPSDDIRQALTAGREGLLAAISGVSEEQFKRRPAAAGHEKPWSIAEVLGHLLQQERLHGEHIALALTSDGATIQPTPPDEQDRGAQAGRVAPVPQLIHGLLASRREIERLLDEAEALPDGLNRHLDVTGGGHPCVEFMLRHSVIEHEAEHAAQILAIRETIGAPIAAGASA